MDTIRNVIIDGRDVECNVYYSICNDGIGPYEYWGFKGVDKGTDYIEIEDIEPVETTPELDKFIEDNFDELANTISVEIEEEGHDGDDWNLESGSWEGGFADNH